jgi:hypothetical protein
MMEPIKFSITNDEIDVASNILGKLEPGYLPFKIFMQIFRLAFTLTTEVIPLRLKDGKVEVLFTKRDDNDPIWPGAWHTPGCVFRATDTSFEESLNRVIENELTDIKFNSEFIRVSEYIEKTKRGNALGIIYYVEVNDNNNIGQFFNERELPDNCVTEQIELINSVIKHFKNIKDIE